MVGELSVSLIRFDVYKNNNDMKQTWKNKWLMLLGGVILLGGLSGCEDRTEEAVVPPADSEEVTVSMVFGFAEDSSDDESSTARLNGSPQRLASTARLNGSPLIAAKLLLM
ncbi:hypothetical protein F030043B2_25710 [Bacteroides fragilis]